MTDTPFPSIDSLSLIGRMACILLCIEQFLITQYPGRDWTPLAEVLWRATSVNWADWQDEYCCYLPFIILSYDRYVPENFSGQMDEELFHQIRALYAGITQGREDDPGDPLCCLLSLPDQMAADYEGAPFDGGVSADAFLCKAEEILTAHQVPLPDFERVAFSRVTERGGWGENFDGRFLSLILHSPT